MKEKLSFYLFFSGSVFNLFDLFGAVEGNNFMAVFNNSYVSAGIAVVLYQAFLLMLYAFGQKYFVAKKYYHLFVVALLAVLVVLKVYAVIYDVSVLIST